MLILMLIMMEIVIMIIMLVVVSGEYFFLAKLGQPGQCSVLVLMKKYPYFPLLHYLHEHSPP